MAVTVRDLFSLDIMKNFKLITGESVLDNTIAGTEILDFEFLQESDLHRERTFDGNSIILTSFLFAKDNPEDILDSIKQLIQLNVHAMAYKPVFFKELPEEAVEYAKLHNFPIMKFGGDEFYEDIIFSIRNLIEKDQAVDLMEEQLRDMVFKDFTEEETSLLYENLNPSFRHEVLGICIKDNNGEEEDIAGILRHGTPDITLKNRIFAGKLEDKYIFILSKDDGKTSGFEEMFEMVKKAYGLNQDTLTIGVSYVHNLDDGIDRVVKEAYWSSKVAEIEKVPIKKYRNIGIYRLIGAHFYSKKMMNYMQEYLAPIMEDDNKDGDLFGTAVEYVLAGGDVAKAGDRLYCHKNTIRYRVAKLQEKLDPNVAEKEFYLNLSTAIKIYLLHN